IRALLYYPPRVIPWTLASSSGNTESRKLFTETQIVTIRRITVFSTLTPHNCQNQRPNNHHATHQHEERQPPYVRAAQPAIKKGALRIGVIAQYPATPEIVEAFPPQTQGVEK